MNLIEVVKSLVKKNKELELRVAALEAMIEIPATTTTTQQENS